MYVDDAPAKMLPLYLIWILIRSVKSGASAGGGDA
jgi:hypothetical protein